MTEGTGPDDVAGLAARLVAWFGANARPYAFRTDPDPYRIWILEVMAQQTQIGRAEERQRRWLKRFPDLAALARAGLPEVLKEWEGLGYYARARNLHRAACLLVAEKRTLPEDYAGLLGVPGIGPYTAASIASIVHGEAVPAVDANARRIATRMLATGGEAELATVAATGDWLAGLFAGGPAGIVNEAIMELGERICRKGKPLCGECPLADGCRALRLGVAAAVPRVAAREHVSVEYAVACFVAGKRLVVEPVPAGELWAGLWRLPLVRLAGPADSDEQRRIIAGLAVRFGFAGGPEAVPLAEVRHSHTRYRIRLHPWLCSVGSDLPGTLPDGAVWADVDDLGQHPFPSAFLKVMGRVFPERIV